jgi:hypothetical protein
MPTAVDGLLLGTAIRPEDANVTTTPLIVVPAPPRLSVREILKSFAALVEALSLKHSPKLKFCLEDVSEARTRWAAPQSRKESWAENGKSKNAVEMHH